MNKDCPIDINCDLGEGEEPSITQAMMQQVSSVNVACGGHAGDLASMEYCVELAGKIGIRLGAHPGLWSRSDFGRTTSHISPKDFSLLVLHQVSALQQIAVSQGIRLNHVKLHGALYHLSDSDNVMACAYVEVMQRHFPSLVIYCRSGGLVSYMARQSGVRVMDEIFADRAYLPDGNLLHRQSPGSVITDPAQVEARLKGWLCRGEMETIERGRVRLNAQTISIHGDTQGAVDLARRIRRILGYTEQG